MLPIPVYLCRSLAVSLLPNWAWQSWNKQSCIDFNGSPSSEKDGVAFLAISSSDVCWPVNEAYILFLPALDMLLLQSCHPSLNRNNHSSSCTDNGHLCEKCRTEQATAKCAGNMKRRMIFGCASKSIKAFWSRFLLLSGFNSEGIF